MKTIGNILWLILVGFSTAIGWLTCALVLAITVIGIPFAVQCVKLASFTLWPFGRTVVHSPTAGHFGWLGNLLWLIPGLILSLAYIVGGVLLCITIIGIPFGIQAFKFVPLAIAPFGKEVISTAELNRRIAAGPMF